MYHAPPLEDDVATQGADGHERDETAGRTLSLLVPVALFIPESTWEQVERAAKELGIAPEELAAKAISTGLSMTHGVG